LPIFEEGGGGGGTGLSYSYVEAGFTTYDVNEIDNDSVSSYYAKGSLSLFKILYGFLEYENSSIDFENTDTNQVTLGAGAPTERQGQPLQRDRRIYSGVQRRRLHRQQRNGYRVKGGARWMALRGMGRTRARQRQIRYRPRQDPRQRQQPQYWNAGARVHFLGHFSVGALYEKPTSTTADREPALRVLIADRRYVVA
jgi:hypothetical protein